MPRSVPELQIYNATVVKLNFLFSEVCADCRLLVFRNFAVYKLIHEGGFAHARVPNQDDFDLDAFLFRHHLIEIYIMVCTSGSLDRTHLDRLLNTFGVFYLLYWRTHASSLGIERGVPPLFLVMRD